MSTLYPEHDYYDPEERHDREVLYDPDVERDRKREEEYNYRWENVDADRQRYHETVGQIPVDVLKQGYDAIRAYEKSKGWSV